MRNAIKLIMLLAIMLTSTLSMAQMYGNALGIRLGNSDDFRSVGLTLQQRIAKKLTLEGIVQTDFGKNTTLHAMIQQHEPLISRRFNYYVGTGVSLGSHSSPQIVNETTGLTQNVSKATLGVDLIAGLELTMLKYTISLDYKPNFNIVGRENWYQGQVGVSVRAVILSGKKYENRIKEKEKEKRQKERDERKQDRNGKIRDFFNTDPELRLKKSD